jgi:hypothetical protein
MNMHQLSVRHITVTVRAVTATALIYTTTLGAQSLDGTPLSAAIEPHRHNTSHSATNSATNSTTNNAANSTDHIQANYAKNNVKNNVTSGTKNSVANRMVNSVASNEAQNVVANNEANNVANYVAKNVAKDVVQHSTHHNRGTVLYHNATVIHPATEQKITDGWLLVQNGNIVAQGQQRPAQPLPAADRYEDLQDQFVMPGLIDVHLHLTAGPFRVEMVNGAPIMTLKGDAEITKYHAISSLAYGITTAFSPAGEPQANAAYAKAQQQGQWLGPELFYAGYVFDPTPIVAGSVYPSDPAQWQAEIARQKAQGVRAIKLYGGLTADEVAQGIAAAKAAGLQTIAHLDQVSWQFAADQGIDMLTHALPTSAELLSGKARSAYQALRQNPANQRFIYQWFAYVD